MRFHDDSLRPTSNPRAPVLPPHAYPTAPPDFFADEEEEAAALNDQLEPARIAQQDKSITGMLHNMALGHLFLGLALTLGSVILEEALHQPAFFGLAASGTMLFACGVILRLNLERRMTLQSPLVFYLLPYADFVNVGLWLLLFGVNGPILLFFAYVIFSAALLLGSRHALVLTLIAGLTIGAVSLGQGLNPASPALNLPRGLALSFMLMTTALALGLVAYVAWLFSLNLDRFTGESARQSEDLIRQRIQVSQQQQQLAEELHALNEYLALFLSGKTQTRMPVALVLLAPIRKNLDMLLEHNERLLHATLLVNRLQERISLVKQCLERLTLGDRSALHTLNSPSKTALDLLSQPLVSIGQQWYELQHHFQRARAEYQSLTSLIADLAVLRQSLSNAAAALSEMTTRSTQSARHLHALLAGEGIGKEKEFPSGSLNSERPLLRELELRARQQSNGLELERTRLVMAVERLEQMENDLRKVSDGLEQALRLPPSSRTMPTVAERTDSTATPGRLPRTTNPLSPDALPPPPRRFSGPLTPPEAEGSRLVH